MDEGSDKVDEVGEMLVKRVKNMIPHGFGGGPRGSFGGGRSLSHLGSRGGLQPHNTYFYIYTCNMNGRRKGGKGLGKGGAKRHRKVLRDNIQVGYFYKIQCISL